MKKILPLVIVIGVGFAVWFVLFKKSDKAPRPPKDQPLAVSKYSAAFNGSVTEALNAYYALSESFVTGDTANINTKTQALKSGLQGIQFDEIQKDTLIYQTAVSYGEGFSNDLDGITGQADITAKRQSFHSFSQNFYDLLRTVNFDGAKVFLQECPMAFNDTEPGIWLSKDPVIRNPYLGINHPEHKNTMLRCGATKDSL